MTHNERHEVDALAEELLAVRTLNEQRMREAGQGVLIELTGVSAAILDHCFAVAKMLEECAIHAPALSQFLHHPTPAEIKQVVGELRDISRNALG